MRGQIVDISTDGRGVIRDGKTVFVKDALPGDLVEYFLVNEKKNYDEADVKEFIQYSDKRKFNHNPLGSAYPLYPLDEDYQLELKKNMVDFNIKRKVGIDLDVKAVASDNYKLNKIRLHVDGGKIGLHSRGTNDIYLPDLEILFGHKDFIETLPKFLKNATYVSLRQADNGLFLATDGEYFGEKIDGVEDINGHRGTLPILEIESIKYAHDIDGFFQNSKSGAAHALKIIGDQARGEVLDLYCGVGFISLYVGKNAQTLTGVEINSSAINHAKDNAKLNEIKNTKFICKDTADYMRTNTKAYDTIIIDPPRSGLHKDVIAGINKTCKKELIYMSCDLGTFTRDLKILKDTFDVEEIYVIDMFKGTSGVECIGKMTRK